ncbi:MAG: hypothetical protein JWM51_2042 [Microbacteriaceae bacterium]|jgi:hypothetical protein|nr:hypothetical protein [Microbacteriaceae bacterium]
MTTTLGPTDEQIRAMRHNIMTQVADDTVPVRSSHSAPHPSRRRRITFAAVGAAAAAAVIVAGLIIPSGTDAPAEAATALRAAADLAITASDPIVGPGQYLKIETTAEYTIVGQTSTGEKVAWVAPQTTAVFRPGDPAADWVMERHQLIPTRFYGDEAKAAAMEDFAFTGRDPLTNGIFRAKDGAFYGPATTKDSGDEFPRDPEELYEYIRAGYAGGSSNPDEDAWVRITDLLRTGTVPADLRSALYDAAAMIPGMEILPGGATLNGRTGIAIGRVESSRDARQEIIIAPETGDLIGERTVRTTAGYGAPAGTIWSATSVTTTVVDSTP